MQRRGEDDAKKRLSLRTHLNMIVLDGVGVHSGGGGGSVVGVSSGGVSEVESTTRPYHEELHNAAYNCLCEVLTGLCWPWGARARPHLRRLQVGGAAEGSRRKMGKVREGENGEGG
ncbi:hypothetical protein Pmani_035699 [Petrolisthes manimaculis]|uniref:Uncharacterized protein n=1 Tax=Petrolisthes manimaculis TaxID=1843537 RepID=A0AAE1NLV1_9EUCA|nr:hypothetical protein Pmani_035699 [Petrolisthes manimaculis]